MVKENYLAQFYGKSQNYTEIPNEWYKEYNVKKGLRNEDGTGVRVGLTRIADVVGYEETADGIKAIPGKLYYRGIDIEDLVKGKLGSHFGYEEVCFLLLFGYLPKERELERLGFGAPAPDGSRANMIASASLKLSPYMSIYNLPMLTNMINWAKPLITIR